MEDETIEYNKPRRLENIENKIDNITQQNIKLYVLFENYIKSLEKKPVEPKILSRVSTNIPTKTTTLRPVIKK